MIELSKEQWKQLEEAYPDSVHIVFRPVPWMVESGMMSEVKYQTKLTEISDLEAKQKDMQYVGTALSEHDRVDYYLDGETLYQFLYVEIMDFVGDDDDDFDTIYTGQYECTTIGVNKGEVSDVQ